MFFAGLQTGYPKTERHRTLNISWGIGYGSKNTQFHILNSEKLDSYLPSEIGISCANQGLLAFFPIVAV